MKIEHGGFNSEGRMLRFLDALMTIVTFCLCRAMCVTIYAESFDFSFDIQIYKKF